MPAVCPWSFRRVFMSCLLTAALAAGSAAAATPTSAPASPRPSTRPSNTKPSAATTPAKSPRAGWEQRHAEMVAEARKGGIDLLFIGDSITDGWRGAARGTWDSGGDVWKRCFAPLKAANFGICGDQTSHLLWRLQNGELDGITPKLAVLMIGTNNSSAGHRPADIAAGIAAIIDTLKAKTPGTRVLLLAIFPAGASAQDSRRVNNQAVNRIIAKFDDGGTTVKFLDIGVKFLQPDGTISKAIMPDLLHLSAKGYQIEAEAILPVIEQMMATPATPTAPRRE